MKDKKGQTIIETALILSILLILILGITEFSRAWFTKNSLKNAVRQGARTAAVTSGIADVAETCPGSSFIVRIVCNSPGMTGVPASVTVSIDKGADATLNAGDTVKVEARHNFEFVAGGGDFWPWAKIANLVASASMRYELQ